MYNIGDMPLTHTQLLNLATAPSATKSSEAYDQIKDALVGNPMLKHVSFTPYLQGSYSNKTNIKEDSDIDVVIEMTSTFRGETSSLNQYELSEYHRFFSNSQYTYNQFRADVLSTLIKEFGQNNVENHNKCIKVLGNNSRLNADVVPAMRYRKYRSFSVYNMNDYVEGIIFGRQKTISK